MKVSILQDQFAKALTIVGRVADSRAPLPVLQNILLRTVDASLELVATDLAVSVVASIGAKIDQPGSITLPAKTLVELAKSLPEERIDLTLDEATQTVHFKVGGKTQANLKGIIATEFPPVPEPVQWNTEIDGLLLRKMIQSVAFCADTQMNRPILTGILTRLDHGCLTLAAVDGYRLGVMEAAVENTHEFQVVIPAEALSNFARLLDDKGDVALAFTDERVFLNFGSVTYGISLLEGKFPDYQALIPKSHETQITVYTEDLLKACKRAEIFARDSNYSTRFKTDTTTLWVRGISTERGDLENELDATMEGVPLEIAFNIRYLIDALNAIDSEHVILESNGPSHPCVVLPEDRLVMFLIMPMSINR